MITMEAWARLIYFNGYTAILDHNGQTMTFKKPWSEEEKAFLESHIYDEKNPQLVRITIKLD